MDICFNQLVETSITLHSVGKELGKHIPSPSTVGNQVKNGIHSHVSWSVYSSLCITYLAFRYIFRVSKQIGCINLDKRPRSEDQRMDSTINGSLS